MARNPKASHGVKNNEAMPSESSLSHGVVFI